MTEHIQIPRPGGPLPKTMKSRARSPVVVDRFKRIKGLHCYQAVYERITHGHAFSEVARFVQEDCGELEDLKSASLVNQLRLHAEEIPKAAFINEHTLPAMHHKVQREFQEGLDVLEELEKIYLIQTKRLAIDVANEEKINKLMKTTHREVRVARELLLTMHKIQTELGLVEKKLGTATLNVNQVNTQVNLVEDTHGEVAAAVLGDSSKGLKVLGVFNRIKRLSAAKAIAESQVSEEAIDVDVG